MEKEQSFRDAALNYEHAWKYGNQNNPTIGPSPKITSQVGFFYKEIGRILTLMYIFFVLNFRIQACF